LDGLCRVTYFEILGTLCIFGTVKDRNSYSGTYTDNNMYYPSHDRLPVKLVWSGYDKLR